MTATVHSLAQRRIGRAPENMPPEWATSIRVCAAYAEMIRAEHAAESARVDFEAKRRGLGNWTDAPDLRDRTDANNLSWGMLRGITEHLASLPASDRSEASIKRNTIGRLWLRAEGDWYDRLRAGCMADDHHYPPSERLVRRFALKSPTGE